MKSILIITIHLLGCVVSSFAQEAYMLRETISSAGGSHEFITLNNSFLVQQSIGQASAIGSFQNENYQLTQGFLQTEKTNAVIESSSSNELDARVFPNPFNDQLKIQLNENLNEKVMVYLTDLTGKTVYTAEFNSSINGVIEINNLMLSAGSYFIQVYSNGKSYTSKLFKS